MERTFAISGRRLDDFEGRLHVILALSVVNARLSLPASVWVALERIRGEAASALVTIRDNTLAPKGKPCQR